MKNGILRINQKFRICYKNYEKEKDKLINIYRVNKFIYIMN